MDRDQMESRAKMIQPIRQAIGSVGVRAMAAILSLLIFGLIYAAEYPFVSNFTDVADIWNSLEIYRANIDFIIRYGFLLGLGMVAGGVVFLFLTVALCRLSGREIVRSYALPEGVRFSIDKRYKRLLNLYRFSMLLVFLGVVISIFMMVSGSLLYIQPIGFPIE